MSWHLKHAHLHVPSAGTPHSHSISQSSQHQPLVKRQSDSAYSSDSSSAATGTGPNSTTIAIACAVVIPVFAALILFVCLHRRNVKRMRIEDATDKNASLDFGLGDVQPGPKGRRGKRGPEMSSIEAQTRDMLRPGKGLSVDMGSPYVLPGEPVSRTSFNSLSRSLQDGEDPYRPVAMLRSGHNSPTLPPSPQYSLPRQDSSGSMLSPSVSSKTGLLSPSSSVTPYQPADHSQSSPIEMPMPPPPIARKPVSSPLGVELEDNSRSELEDNSTPYHEIPTRSDSAAAPQLQHELPTVDFQSSFNLPDDNFALHNGQYDDSRNSAPPPPPKRSSLRDASPHMNEPQEMHQPQHEYQHDYQHEHQHEYQQEYQQEYHHEGADEPYQPYTDVLGIAQAPQQTEHELPTIQEPEYDGLGLHNLDWDVSRYSAHIRPLPVTDPNDTAEQRANRIRSFYREYFDDNENIPAGAYAAQYYEDDYGQEYQNDGAVYDPATGQFIMPGAPYGQPIGRRAMTPPPRGPPRFRGGYGTRSSGGTYSGGPRQRAYSSASGRPYTGGPRGRPVKKLPPPKPLKTLPTASKLKDDTAIFNAMDFAPPTTFRDRQLGRPESPGGGVARPYSPAVRAFTPLVSSFDDLAVMPSP